MQSNLVERTHQRQQTTSNRVRTIIFAAVVQCIVICIAEPAQGAATGSRQKQYREDFDTIWATTIGVLQAHGDPIIYNDKASGVITTDYKIEEDEEWRHKFNLLLTKNSD